MADVFKNDPEFSEATKKPTAGRRFTPLGCLGCLGGMLLLIALLLPASRGSRGAARRAQCVNNLKQIGLALHNYEQVYNALPPAYTVDVAGRPLHSWRTLILPYLEQGPLYQTIDLAKPWNDPANARAFGTPVSSYRCPETTGPPNTTTYLAFAGPNGCLVPGRPRRLTDITDAHASTLMVIEVGRENAAPWMAPVDASEALVLGLGPDTKLDHAGGSNAVFVDGSVRFLKATTPASVRRAWTSISGNDDRVDTDR